MNAPLHTQLSPETTEIFIKTVDNALKITPTDRKDVYNNPFGGRIVSAELVANDKKQYDGLLKLFGITGPQIHIIDVHVAYDSGSNSYDDGMGILHFHSNRLATIGFTHETEKGKAWLLLQAVTGEKQTTLTSSSTPEGAGLKNQIRDAIVEHDGTDTDRAWQARISAIGELFVASPAERQA